MDHFKYMKALRKEVDNALDKSIPAWPTIEIEKQFKAFVEDLQVEIQKLQLKRKAEQQRRVVKRRRTFFVAYLQQLISDTEKDFAGICQYSEVSRRFLEQYPNTFTEDQLRNKIYKIKNPRGRSSAQEAATTVPIDEGANGPVHGGTNGLVDEEATGLVHEDATGLIHEDATGLVHEDATGLVHEDATGLVHEGATEAVNGLAADEATLHSSPTV